MKRLGITVLLLALLLTGCLYPKGTPAAAGLYEPFYIADANVPLARLLSPGHFDRVTELERDSYGRAYYSYRTPSGVYGGQIDIHIISQPPKDDRVLYYPDICYMIRLEDGEPFTQEQIDRLKRLNDWELPLNEEKTYSVSNSQWHKDIAYEEVICEKLRHHLKLNESDFVVYNGLEYKNSHEQLMFVGVSYYDEGPKEDWESAYYLMVYCDLLYRPVILCRQVEDPMNCQEQIMDFRAEWMVYDA